MGENTLTVSWKILVVEDDDDSRDLLVMVLELHGFNIVTGVDGREGLIVAEAEHPDLIITDLQMPHLDGIEMIRLLRQHSLLSTIPILVLTAYGNVEAANAVMAGADQAMTKPIEFNPLMSCIEVLLRGGESLKHSHC